MPKDNTTLVVIGLLVVLLFLLAIMKISSGSGIVMRDFTQEFYQTWTAAQGVLRLQGYTIVEVRQAEGLIVFTKRLTQEEVDGATKPKVPARQLEQVEATGQMLVLPLQRGGTRVTIKITEITGKKRPSPPGLEPSSFFQFLIRYIINPKQYQELQDVSYESSGKLERELMKALVTQLARESWNASQRPSGAAELKAVSWQADLPLTALPGRSPEPVSR